MACRPRPVPRQAGARGACARAVRRAPAAGEGRRLLIAVQGKMPGGLSSNACLPKVGTGFGTKTCIKSRTKAHGANPEDRDALLDRLSLLRLSELDRSSL
ncbi:hypothetical protein MPLDJ20_140393 [Mesorhizobium plurifarium]|uniref:Uncharacterized protein n=1 Tax=Mesorhizobium plurifarium TaxID=69974 RepID=A0A090ELN9_MESPL|nr:hypothetical protein MPLDJ20_140393 [Mesorhizobium plurifarium]CDX61254.1 hypothetical protein MPL1032_360055 [Mesorhizobium plurifarium]